ncbi:type VII secretion protein EccE [Mycobacterium sp.]|uniref:type VII secretion protein EccE n=1 Tax=Mycobacterium sp. TaxID=1785 RepID=UPI002CB0C53B|nr:type VII secretion protein EccE [Mycobacterium sp.]HME48079.1 type VII secretion protein EccE [Mycobacterium sp.]
MKQPLLGVRARLPTVIAAEVTALAVTALLLAAGTPGWPALAVGVLVAVLGLVLTFSGLALWHWMWLAARWVRHRQRKVALADGTDIEVDGAPVGVIIDGHTVITMVAVWGRQYIPTLLHARHAETPNTLPLTVIAEHMHRFGLGVDVDVVCEGRRTGTDSYAGLYSTFLGPRPAAGKRSTTLVLRMDTRDADTTRGLLWRRNTAEAAAAITRRMVRALRQAGCRAQILTAAQMHEATVASLGGPEDASQVYRDEWSALHRPGRGYLTSYYLSADDVRASQIDEVWSYPAEHTTLVMALRRDASAVRASVVVRLRTGQPLTSAPSLVLNRFTGRQWDALALTLPRRARLTGLPSSPVDQDLNAAVVVGPSGVIIGKLGDGLLLMPLSDPSGPTRIAMHTDDDVAVRRLIRRAAAAGELVAVYDSTGRWTMRSASSHIWTSRDLTAQPPRPPTLVVHNGNSDPYPGAWVSIAVNGGSISEPDIVIEQRGDRIHLGTKRFNTVVEAVSFRNEQPYLN